MIIYDMFRLCFRCMFVDIFIIAYYAYFLPYVFNVWESFSGGAPVRSRPRLSGYNWCLIRRGRDKLVSERGFIAKVLNQGFCVMLRGDDGS